MTKPWLASHHTNAHIGSTLPPAVEPPMFLTEKTPPFVDLRVEDSKVAGFPFMFTYAQETTILNMVLAGNCIRLREIHYKVISDHDIFKNTHQVSLTA